MKWYQHESSCHSDEKIRDLIHREGLAGYAAYHICLEIISGKIDEKMAAEIEITDRVLCEKLNSRPVTVARLLASCSAAALLAANKVGSNWIIKCPNLLKRLDNWTKRSVVTTKQVPLEYNKNKKENKKEKLGASLPAQDFLASLKENEAYKGIDIENEMGKCKAWCLANKKVLSQRRFVNWLNRAEKPFKAETKPDSLEAILNKTRKEQKNAQYYA